MTRRNRTLLYGAIAFVICVILILATAYGQGADPLHPRTRHIWALTLFAALYVSFRGAKVVEKLTRRFGFFKSEHAIDKRMAARKERVEAARQREAEAPEQDE